MHQVYKRSDQTVTAVKNVQDVTMIDVRDVSGMQTLQIKCTGDVTVTGVYDVSEMQQWQCFR